MKVQKKSTKVRKTNVAMFWDTCFDRVATILEKDNTLDIAQFKDNTVTIVVGSSCQKMKISL
jgi:3-deoxy-D-manno-octulosonic-acid transferase